MPTLRPYQAEAVDRVVDRGNLLLALTMGAGKTATAICAVRRLRRLRQVDHGVVFALKSTKYQWVREINRWDPRATVHVVEGDKQERTKAIRRSPHFHYTIMHYECLVNDWEAIRKWLPHDFVIADEATYIKGFAAKRTRRAKALGEVSKVRIALSGQPVENRPEELFSIMEFVDATVLGGFHRFDRTFIERDYWGKPKKYRNLHVLEKALQGAMFRRSREDISEWLPEMIEIEMPVVLDLHTQILHDTIKQDLREAIDNAQTSGGQFDLLAHYGRTQGGRDMALMGAVMSRLLAMRMLSSHPKLLRLSADAFDTEVSRWGSSYASELKARGLLDGLPDDTAKLEALFDQVTMALDDDPRHKVVVFSYFKPMLALIRSTFTAARIPSVLLTGDTPTAKRDEAIVRFNTDPKCRLFLSSDAGAYGVDLNQGSHLVCYDLPWSAGALQQRISRIDRTNSAFDQIMVTYLYGLGTIEERMYRMLTQKQAVSRAFVDFDFDPKGNLTLDLESLREFVDS